MSRYAPAGSMSSIGPGPWTPAIRAIIILNALLWLVRLAVPGPIAEWLGLIPQAVIEQGRVWQLATYLFVHDTGLLHVLFNMLLLWMFGVDLERRWGTRGFLKYYFIVGIGAGVSTVLVSLLPFSATAPIYAAATIGASGAVYGVMLAWALLFPHRQILFMMFFPLPARVAVGLMGLIAFYNAMQYGGGTVAEFTHLGGLVVGLVYLKGPRNLSGELRYRLTKWRLHRLRRKFDVHPGGRGPWDGRVH